MRKRTYFAELGGFDWPDPTELERYFLDETGASWPVRGGNDEWGLSAEGLFGTDTLPDESNRVDVYLDLIGYPNLGVTLYYARWDGRIKQKVNYQSEGDMHRAKEIVYSLQGDPKSVASFVPFADGYKAVKEFIETGGELPTCIKWGRGVKIPEEAFFYPGVPAAIPRASSR
jgi:hypothetical protein